MDQHEQPEQLPEQLPEQPEQLPEQLPKKQPSLVKKPTCIRCNVTFSSRSSLSHHKKRCVVTPSLKVNIYKPSLSAEEVDLLVNSLDIDTLKSLQEKGRLHQQSIEKNNTRASDSGLIMVGSDSQHLGQQIVEKNTRKLVTGTLNYGRNMVGSTGQKIDRPILENHNNCQNTNELEHDLMSDNSKDNRLNHFSTEKAINNTSTTTIDKNLNNTGVCNYCNKPSTTLNKISNSTGVCNFCNKTFTTTANVSNHMRICRVKADYDKLIIEFKKDKETTKIEFNKCLNIANLEIDRLNKLLQIEQDYRIKDKETYLNDLDKANTIIKKEQDGRTQDQEYFRQEKEDYKQDKRHLQEDKKNYLDLTKTNQQIQSMSAFNFLQTYFTVAPCLKPINDFSPFSGDYEDDNIFIKEEILYQFRNKLLPTFIGDYLVKVYKTDDPQKQTFWTTDIYRFSCLIRKFIKNGGLKWIHDKNGMDVTSDVIMPLLEHLTGLLKTFIQYCHSERNKSKNSYKQEEYASYQKEASLIITTINNKSLEKNIQKYIAPKLYLDKHLAFLNIENNKNLLEDKTQKNAIIEEVPDDYVSEDENEDEKNKEEYEEENEKEYEKEYVSEDENNEGNRDKEDNTELIKSTKFIKTTKIIKKRPVVQEKQKSKYKYVSDDDDEIIKTKSTKEENFKTKPTKEEKRKTKPTTENIKEEKLKTKSIKEKIKTKSTTEGNKEETLKTKSMKEDKKELKIKSTSKNYKKSFMNINSYLDQNSDTDSESHIEENLKEESENLSDYEALQEHQRKAHLIQSSSTSKSSSIKDLKLNKKPKNPYETDSEC